MKKEMLDTLNLGCDDVLENFPFDAYCKSNQQFKQDFRIAKGLLEEALEEIISGKHFSIRDNGYLRVIMTSSGAVSLSYIFTSYDYNPQELQESSEEEEEDWTYFGC